MIVFGHNSFLLNECKPSQLGMAPDLDAVYTIERRQRYAHLFWIPVFGIGKIWALRKRSDNNLYVPNAELERALNALPFADKTPWYTFAFLFLIMGGGLIFFISETVSDFQSKRRQEQYLQEKNQSLTKAINAPQPYHYYDMKQSGEHVYLKVVKSDQNNITCLYSKKQDPNYSDYRILEAFVVDSVNRTFDTVKIAKADFLKAINEKDNYSFEGYEIIPGAGKLAIDEFKEFAFPVFKNLQTAYEEGEFFAVIQNIGEGASFKGMKTESSNVTFEGAVLPEKIKAGDLIFIKGTYADAEPKLSSKVKFINNAKDSAEYNFSIYSSYLTLEKSKR